ncbi:MAG TPA: CBS domain-containing protein [Candidatus Methanomethylophilaceae archaeon]|nr:CBS domain-containing protein [Candidatus Methanomethylophilaceae archaeon]
MKTVSEIMTLAPIVAEVPGTRNNAINTMVRNDLTGLPVIRGSDGKLVGVVSRRDLFRKFEEDQLSLIMKKDPISVDSKTTISEAAEIFFRERFHRLPVTEDGKLVGIITPTDLLDDVRALKSKITAEEAIQTTCVTAWEHDPLSYTVPAMRISDVPAVPVLDEKGILVGILTDRDLFSDQSENPEAMKALGIEDTSLAGYRNVLPLFYTATDRYLNENKDVSDFMVRDPITVYKKTSISEVAKIMKLNDFGQIPVRGSKDELVGMIYDVDILMALFGN